MRLGTSVYKQASMRSVTTCQFCCYAPQDRLYLIEGLDVMTALTEGKVCVLLLYLYHIYLVLSSIDTSLVCYSR